MSTKAYLCVVGLMTLQVSGMKAWRRAQGTIKRLAGSSISQAPYTVAVPFTEQWGSPWATKWPTPGKFNPDVTARKPATWQPHEYVPAQTKHGERTHGNNRSGYNRSANWACVGGVGSAMMLGSGAYLHERDYWKNPQWMSQEDVKLSKLYIKPAADCYKGYDHGNLAGYQKIEEGDKFSFYEKQEHSETEPRFILAFEGTRWGNPSDGFAQGLICRGKFPPTDDIFEGARSALKKHGVAENGFAITGHSYGAVLAALFGRVSNPSEVILFSPHVPRSWSHATGRRWSELLLSLNQAKGRAKIFATQADDATVPLQHLVAAYPKLGNMVRIHRTKGLKDTWFAEAHSTENFY